MFKLANCPPRMTIRYKITHENIILLKKLTNQKMKIKTIAHLCFNKRL